MGAIIFLGLAAVSFIPGMEKRYVFQVMMGVLFCCLLKATKIASQSNWIGALLFLMVASSGAYLCFFPISPYAEYGTMGVMKFSWSAAQSLLYLLAVILPVLLTDDIDLGWWITGFAWLGFMSAVMIIVKFTMKMPPDSILDNPAMDGSFIACLYPLMVFRRRSWTLQPDRFTEPVSAILTWAFILFPPIAIVLTKSSTAMAVFFGMVALYRFLDCKYFPSIKGLAEAGLILILGMILSKIWLGSELLNPNGRLFFWQTAAAQWIYLGHYWFGNGAGSFENLSPLVQIANNSRNVAFWAHNEYVQVCFEYGIVGLALLLLFLGSWIRAAVKASSAWMLVTVLGIAASAVLQMPLRLYPWSLFCAVMVRITFKVAKEEHDKSTISRSLEI